MRTWRDRALRQDDRDFHFDDRWHCHVAGGERRSARRTTCKIPASFRERERSRIPAEILNLSVRGCTVASAASPRVGALCWVKLPSLASSSACVAWVRENRIGLYFTELLHPAVTEMMICRHAWFGTTQN